MVAFGGRARRAVALVLLLSLAACTPAAPPAPSAAPRLGPAARTYLEAALDIMQRHALNRARLDWPFLRQRALREAATAGARSPADVYGVIRLTLGNLDDNFHSRLYAPGERGRPTLPDALPSGQVLSRSIGYLDLPGSAVLQDANPHYISAADDVLRRAHQQGICGWVLDLRDDVGGDVWPMLVAAQPLLGSGTVGYFVPPQQPRTAVRVTPAAAYADDKVVTRARTSARPYFGDAPVAVLTGPRTASAGEFMAIAFRNRQHTRSFGLATSGVPTGNDAFRLSDGALLVLTTAQDADRTGRVYLDAPIRPDQTTATASPTATSSGADAAITAARAWLTTERNCH